MLYLRKSLKSSDKKDPEKGFFALVSTTDPMVGDYYKIYRRQLKNLHKTTMKNYFIQEWKNYGSAGCVHFFIMEKGSQTHVKQ